MRIGVPVGISGSGSGLGVSWDSAAGKRMASRLPVEPRAARSPEERHSVAIDKCGKLAVNAQNVPEVIVNVVDCCDVAFGGGGFDAGITNDNHA